MSGFVSFVSAGPGDPELLTLKAVARLAAADAVLFDDLASGPILAHAHKDADLVAVGKRAGQPSPRQSHVSQLLVDYARTGAKVVRLKSGDAGLFGRLEEEIIALRAAGIEFEIIPGVTSALAAAAAAAIPLTRRMTARRVQFVTGHDTKGTLPDDMDIQALADPTATTVVFMGQRTFAQFVQRLVAAGLPPETPAMLAKNISRPDQHISRWQISGLATHLAQANNADPALIVYGPLMDAQDD
ncbi:uroporphyrinogen-III C-methyltransferase [Aureimonas fodinaquatilis]|uniref:uroporphyrinogen-III C-methyltransferase n=1 Tax=Aureimonas fodinaquatilis TaxID=2565783 RepID=A0A5B0DVA1_9HYPH|nr:uroporphyrinogen-III C-methyltransferase [Aureimonas fodinaquatilis]KAA0969540.1 uroporphyrinogen-III C-methyltransferase [Aureimonas fodinaquatilis]